LVVHGEPEDNRHAAPVAAQVYPEMHPVLPLHVVAHVLPLHARFDGQAVVVGPIEHAPVPLHWVATFSVLPEHDTDEHAVPRGACSQAPPAAHFPSLPHGGCATQLPDGSVVPAMTAAQLPFATPVSAIEQAWHCPLQAVPQQ
jgi:hypothetical protein